MNTFVQESVVTYSWEWHLTLFSKLEFIFLPISLVGVDLLSYPFSILSKSRRDTVLLWKKSDVIEKQVFEELLGTSCYLYFTLTWKMPDWFDVVTAKLWQSTEAVLALLSFCTFFFFFLCHILYKRNYGVRKIQSIKCIHVILHKGIIWRKV